MKLRLLAVILLITNTLFCQNYHDTQGKLEISNAGQATYTLPIAMPPSLKNVGPVINLTYASGQIGGIAGQGWNISSISNISRIATRKDIDGFVDGVDFDDNDKLALDGQRLILKSGTYWEDGSTYQTEVQSNTKIEMRVSSKIGLYSYTFIVTNPDGSRAWYGNSGGGEFAVDLTAFYITRFEDTHGNYMTYHYTNPYGGSLCVSEIKFSANTGLVPLNSILFNYEPAKRKEFAYVKGVKHEKTATLVNIEVKTNKQLFRKYQFTHTVDSEGYQRVQQLQEFNGTLEPANPVVFEYNTTPGNIDIIKNLSYKNNLSFDKVQLSGDFDGDGRLDFLANRNIYTNLFNGSTENAPINAQVVQTFNRNVFTATTITNNKLNQFQSIVSTPGFSNLFTATKSFEIYNVVNNTLSLNYTKTVDIGTAIIEEGPEENILPTLVAGDYGQHDYSGTPPKETVSESLEGDFNADGISEVFIINHKLKHHIKTKFYTNTTGVGAPLGFDRWRITEYAGSDAYLLDLNPNTSTVLGDSGFVKFPNINIPFKDTPKYVADFNGDGKSDILIFSEDGYKVYNLKGLTESPWAALEIIGQGKLTPSSSSSGNNIKPFLLGDYNGDGKVDIMIPEALESSNWIIYYSNPKPNGASFFDAEVKSIIPYHPRQSGDNYEDTESYYAMDVNKDGKTDLVKFFTSRFKDSWFPETWEVNWYADAYTNNIGNASNSNFVYAYTTGMQDDNRILPTVVTSNYRHQGLNTDLLLLIDNPVPNVSNPAPNEDEIHYFRFNKDFKVDNMLKKVTASSGNIVDEIEYKTMELGGFYSSNNSVNYPNIEINNLPSNYLVSKLKNTSVDITKYKDFIYNGMVVNMNGLGSIGFMNTARSNWYLNSTDKRIWNVTQNNPLMRGATTISYSQLFDTGNAFLFGTTTGLISSIKSTFVESTKNNVYSILLNSQTTTDHITGVTNTTDYTYDPDYLLPLSTTTNNFLDTTLQGTTTTSNVFENNPVGDGGNYYIGRPKLTTTQTTAYGNTVKAEEELYYTNNRLIKTKKRGNTAEAKYLVEDFEYDIYGNVNKKTLRSEGYLNAINPRSTEYTYDATGRFVTSVKDIEGLVATNDTFDSLYGIVLKSTNPFGLSTTTEIDNWGKVKKTTNYLGKSINYSYTKSGNEYTIVKTADDGSTSFAISDVLGRPKKTGVKNIDNTWSYKSIEYDFLGRKYRESEPYNLSPSLWNTTTYDDYNRIIQSIASTKLTTKITYTGTTVIANDGTRITTSVKNANGHVVSSTDNGGTINYTYYANGNLKISNFEGTTISMTYDEWARKTRLTDPSAGIYEYTYYPSGESKTEKTPKGTTTYTLDIATGKLKEKTIVGDLTNSKTTYNYDPISKLLLSTKFDNLIEGNNTTNTIVYDDFKRIIQSKEITPYAEFTKNIMYDAFGRVDKETSTAIVAGKTSAKTTVNKYKNGSHYQILDDSNTPKVLWQTNTVNARGQLTGATLGNGISIANSYDEFGFAKEIKHNTGGATPVNVMTLGYNFDEKRGNLNNRSNSMLNWNEAFAYDNLDRLIEFTNAKGVKELQDYDNKGRILKNNVGDYKYTNTAKQYQNTSVDLTAEAMSYYTNREGVFNDSMENEKEWGAVNHPGAVFYSYDTTKSYSGTTSLKFTNTTTTVQYAHSNKWIPIVNPVATQYTISARVYSNNAVQVGLFMFMGKGNEGMDNDPNLPYDYVQANTLPQSWKLITKVVTVPAGTVKLNLRLDNYATGEVWFDDIKIIKTADALPTGIFNEDMEKRSGWNSLALMGTNVKERLIDYFSSAPKANSGQYYLRITNDNTTEKVVHNENWIAINNTVDTNYTYSVWTYTSDLDPKVSLLMKTADELGYYTQIDNVTSNLVAARGKWVLIKKTVLVPASIKKLNIRLDLTTRGTIFFDDVKIQKWGDNNTLKVLNTSYNAFKSPVEIEETGIDKLSFTYNDSNDRSAMFYGSLDYDKLKRPLRKYYSGDGTMEVKYNTLTNAVEFLTYIGGDGYSAPIALKSDGTTQNYLYLHRDYQGSILAITDDNAKVLEKRLFDAWGNIVKVQDGNGLPIAQGSWLIDRGYTGHEHLQSIGIIHMNGRLYDPKLHRFLQPDNYVQDPYNTQNYNRYGYVLNNPLKYTDPSGELGVGLGAAVLVGAIVAATTYTITAIANDNFTVGGLVQATFMGAVSAAVSFGIGSAAGTINNFFLRATFQALAHGTFQGGITAIQGGNFWSGFAAGSISSIVSSAIGGGNSYNDDGTISASHQGLNGLMHGGSSGMIFFGTFTGGAAAQLTGGNFWEGALSGFMVSALNHYAHEDDGPIKKLKPKTTKEVIDGSLGGVGTGLGVASTYGTLLEKYTETNAKFVYKFGSAGKSAAQLTSSNKAFQLGIGKVAKIGGKVFLVAGIATTGYQVSNDINNGKYYSASARTAVFAVALGSTAIPVVGWGVALGIGVADMVWGDDFYNYIENKIHK
jgi:RHS repeat-associated protein